MIDLKKIIKFKKSNDSIGESQNIQTVKEEDRNLIFNARRQIIKREKLSIEKKNNQSVSKTGFDKKIRTLETVHNFVNRTEINSITPFQKIRISLSNQRDKRKEKIECNKFMTLKLNIQNNEKNIGFSNPYLNRINIIYPQVKVIKNNKNLVSVNKMNRIKRSKLSKSIMQETENIFQIDSTIKKELTTKFFNITSLNQTNKKWYKFDLSPEDSINKKTLPSKTIYNKSSLEITISNDEPKNMKKSDEQEIDNYDFNKKLKINLKNLKFLKFQK